jgi:hypothetical protein
MGMPGSAGVLAIARMPATARTPSTVGRGESNSVRDESNSRNAENTRDATTGRLATVKTSGTKVKGRKQQHKFPSTAGMQATVVKSATSNSKDDCNSLTANNSRKEATTGIKATRRLPTQ